MRKVCFRSSCYAVIKFKCVQGQHKQQQCLMDVESLMKYINLEINTAGPRLVSIFGNTRDHINILVKTNSYDIYF